MDNECVDAILRVITGEREKELEIVKNCPSCFYKSIGYGGCEVYRANIMTVALVMPMENIPEQCPLRQAILDEKARLRRDAERFEEKHKRVI